MFVEYVVQGRKSLRGTKDVIDRCIIEVEDELDKGEEGFCLKYEIERFTTGQIRLYAFGVHENWRPGQVYERMLRDKLCEEGCELELVTTTP